MKSLFVLTLIGSYFFTTEDPQKTLSRQYDSYVTMQSVNPNGIQKLRRQILDDPKRMLSVPGKFVDTNIDWEAYAESIFRPNWDKLTKVQQKEFKRVLQRDAIERYGTLFSPSSKFSVKFNGDTQYEGESLQRLVPRYHP